MASQGTLAITKNNKVTLKLITGSNGYYMPIVLAWLAMNPKATQKSYSSRQNTISLPIVIAFKLDLQQLSLIKANSVP